MKGLEKDMQMQLTAFFQGVSGLQPLHHTSRKLKGVMQP